MLMECLVSMKSCRLMFTTILLLCFWSISTGRRGGAKLDQGVKTVSKLEEPRLTWNKRLNRTIVVDLLSIGSKKQKELQQMQIETFATHKTVRNFFVADENVDGDPSCDQALQIEDTLEISKFCGSKKWSGKKPAKYWYIPPKRLVRKANPPGWMCAQQRPLFSLFEVQKRYMHEPLPDYLVVMDDDTYFNMNKFQKHFTLEGSSQPRAIAGCRMNMRDIFHFPLGGFGLILSRRMLQDLMNPIDCSANRTADGICDRIQMNRIGEYEVFQDMASGSLVELMKRYAERSAFRDYKKWTTGYCLHSDMATGYLIFLHGKALGAYNSRPGMLSEFSLRNEKGPNMCHFEGNLCTAESEACHYARGVMSSVFQEQKNQNPSEFSKSPVVVELR